MRALILEVAINTLGETMTQFVSTQNHYEVLALPPAKDSDSAPTSDAIKSAYHRALLVHHPDKSSHRALPSTASRSKYTIDQISQAYRILSDPKSRSSFDRKLGLYPQLFTVSTENTISVSGVTPNSETVDLDDLVYDDEQRLWYRGCRCGQKRGFMVTENHLESHSGEGEALVGCAGCSLWIKVLFAVEDGE